VIAFIALGMLAIPLVVMKQRTLLKSKRTLFDLSACKEAPYVLFVIGRFTGFIGLFVPFFTSTFAMGKTGATQQLAFYLIPILNAASTFGWRIPGFVADRFGPLNVLIPCTSAAGILTFSWITVHDVGGIIVFAVLYGFFSGTLALRSPHHVSIFFSYAQDTDISARFQDAEGTSIRIASCVRSIQWLELQQCHSHPRPAPQHDHDPSYTNSAAPTHFAHQLQQLVGCVHLPASTAGNQSIRGYEFSLFFYTFPLFSVSICRLQMRQLTIPNPRL
jgi:hypothetical protein